MSLTRFVRRADVRAQLKLLRPAIPRQLSIIRKCPPKSNHSSLIGTAFDYLLRFELHRRTKDVVKFPWVAELAAARLSQPPRLAPALLRLPMFADNGERRFRRAALADRVVSHAKVAELEYRSKRRVTAKDQSCLAAHALRLAKLDIYYRCGEWDDTCALADPADMKELLSLLSIVPYRVFTPSRKLLLNPNFASCSRLVGGADADLIVDDVLIDVKTIKMRHSNRRTSINF